MSEAAPFTGVVIDYDARNPESRLSYPFLNILPFENGSELITVSVCHFSGMTDTKDSENWQFPIYYDILRYFAEQQSERPTIALNEGSKRTIGPDDSIEAILAREGDPGLFTKIMQEHGIPVDSWDVTAGDEVLQFLWHYSGDDSFADALKTGWPTESEFKQAVGYFEIGKYAAQFVRQRAEGYLINDFLGYARSRPDAQGALSVLADNGIDTSADSLEAMHAEVCAEAGGDLPFDPSTDSPDTHTSNGYADLHFPPANTSTGDYFVDYRRAQRIGGLASRILRNEFLAERLIGELADPKRVIVGVRERHAMDTLAIMHDELEHGLPLSMMQMVVGESACRQYIGLNYGFGSSHLEGSSRLL